MNVDALNFKGLILDFGAVVTRLPFEALDLIEQGFGLPPGSLDWRGPLDPERDPLWRDVVAGRISEREYWPIRASEIGARIGGTWNAPDLFRRIVDLVGEAWLRPEMLRTIDECRARGARVCILSNELELFLGEHWRKRFAVFDNVEAIIDATTTQIFKPDPRAYRLAMDAIGVAPREALFVDDQPRNVEGAKAVGLNALQFDIRDVAGSIAKVRGAMGLTN